MKYQPKHADRLPMVAPMIVAVLVTLVAVGVLIMTSGSAPAQAAPTPHRPSPVWMTTACEYEDSTDCFWNARVRGNGEGHSYYAVQMKHRVCILFWQRAYAAKHDRCFRD